MNPILRVTFDLMARGFAEELEPSGVRCVERAVHHEERRGGVSLAFLAATDIPAETYGLWAIPEGQ